MTTATLRPSAVGDLTECLPSPAVPNWQNVDETQHDSDTTFVTGDLELLPAAS